MLLSNLIKTSFTKYSKLNIKGLAINSKDVKKKFIFFAVKGNNSNGEDYIKE
jgi:UDP-N-acetylmuramyl tripeptide synthase